MISLLTTLSHDPLINKRLHCSFLPFKDSLGIIFPTRHLYVDEKNTSPVNEPKNTQSHHLDRDMKIKPLEIAILLQATEYVYNVYL